MGLVACAEQPTSNSEAEGELAVLAGTVWYRERIALPPGAEVRVSLQDVAKQDVAAVLIGETSFTPDTGPPYPFEISYDPDRIHDRGVYTVRASIRYKGQLVFSSDQHIPAFGDEPPSILVRRVPAMRARPQKQEQEF
jgi:putative lipoprotein